MAAPHAGVERRGRAAGETPRQAATGRAPATAAHVAQPSRLPAAPRRGG